jgi:hypothetical protein
VSGWADYRATIMERPREFDGYGVVTLAEEANALLMATTDSELTCLLLQIVACMHGRLDFE